MVNDFGVNSKRRVRPPSNMMAGGPSTSSSLSDVIDNDLFYDTAAASEAFNNAPKVRGVIPPHRSAARRSKSRNRMVDSDDEDVAIYDEQNDMELNSKITAQMKEMFLKKVNAANAFENHILEKLPAVVQAENLQCVGAMLDASAKVYSFRVDNTHCECFTVRTNIEEDNKLKRKEHNNVQSTQNGDLLNGTQRVVVDGEISEQQNEEGDPDLGGDSDPEINVNDGMNMTKMGRKKIFKDMRRGGINSTLMDDLNAEILSLNERFLEITTPSILDPSNYVDYTGKTPNPDDFMDGLDNFEQQWSDLALRRIGLPFIEDKPGALDRETEEYGIDDPIYHKVAKEFEEGCAQSFVNNEVLSNQDGSFLILHTNWKEDELNAKIEPFNQRSGNDSNFNIKDQFVWNQLAGAMERGTSSDPSEIFLLQEFCRDEDEEIDTKNKKKNRHRRGGGGQTSQGGGPNEISGVRLLGRRSVDVRAVMQQTANNNNNNPIEGGHDIESVTDDSQSTMDSTMESGSILQDVDQSFKAHKILAKFRLSFNLEMDHNGGGNVHKIVKENLFEGLGEDLNAFFSTDFTHLANIDSYSCKNFGIDTASLRLISDIEAEKIFGIPKSLFFEIKNEIKLRRKMSEKFLKDLCEAIGFKKLMRFNVVVKLNELMKDFNGDNGETSDINVQAQINYLVTRFSPLVDSIWHSVIKEANEMELFRIGIPIGASQMSTHKNNIIYKHNNATLMHSQHKRKPYSTEVPFSVPRTPITPFATNNSTIKINTTTINNNAPSTSLKKRIGTARRIFQDTTTGTTAKKNPLTEQSAKKLKRMDTLEIGDSEDEEFHSRTTTPSVKKFRKMGIHNDGDFLLPGVNIRICFWARPRHYPIVYLGQTIDDKDNPMQSVDVADLDQMMEEFSNQNPTKHPNDSSLAEICTQQLENSIIQQQNRRSIEEIEADRLIQELENDEKENEPSLKAANEEVTIGIASSQQNCLGIGEHDDGRGENPQIFNDDFVDAMDFQAGDENDLDDVDGLVNPPPPPSEEPVDVNEIFGDTQSSRPSTSLEYSQMEIDVPENKHLNERQKQQQEIEDHSHWKGINNQVEVPADKIAERKKVAPKPRRRRENDKDDLTEEMFWNSSDTVNPAILEVIKKHQLVATTAINYNLENVQKQALSKRLFYRDKDYDVDFSGKYNKAQILTTDLFYKSNKSYCTAFKDIFLPILLTPKSITFASLEDQHRRALQIYVSAKESSTNTIKRTHLTNNPNNNNNAMEMDNEIYPNANNDEFNLPFMNNNNNRNEYDIELPEQEYHSNSSSPLAANKDGFLGNNENDNEDDNQLEFNGGIIKICQSRVKAPMVKRAIAAVLSNKEMDIYSLEKIGVEYTKDKLNTNNPLLGEQQQQNDVVITDEIASKVQFLLSNDNESDDVSSDSSSSDENAIVDSNSSDEEEIEENNEIAKETRTTTATTSGVQGISVSAVNQLSLNGEHFYENILAFMPQYLSGRTKHDLNAINAFAITLHMCNEHNLYLEQKKDPSNPLLVHEEETKNFRVTTERPNQ